MRSGAIAAVAAIGFGYGALAQSGAPNTASKEWPTYGHDPGGIKDAELPRPLMAYRWAITSTLIM